MDRKLTKNYLNHPLWRFNPNTEFLPSSIQSLFNFKGYSITVLSDLSSTDAVNTRRIKDILIRSSVNADIMANIDIYLIKKDKIDFGRMSHVLGRLRIPSSYSEMQFLVEEDAQIRHVLKGERFYLVEYDELTEVKYLYTALPEVNNPTTKSILRKILRGDSHIIAESKSLLGLTNTINTWVKRISADRIQLHASLRDFFDSVDWEQQDDTTGIPKSIIFYYKMKNRLSSGWKMELKDERTTLTYAKPIETRNAYVGDKLVPLKLPMWIEEIQITVFENGGVNVMGKGFHNDLSRGAMSNEFRGLCLGNINVGMITQGLYKKSAHKQINETLDRITRAFSTTNLDHPMWQFGTYEANVLNRLQVIGEGSATLISDEAIAVPANAAGRGIEPNPFGRDDNQVAEDAMRANVDALTDARTEREEGDF